MSFDDTFRKEAIKSDVCLCMYYTKPSRQTHEHTKRRETLKVWSLWICDYVAVPRHQIISHTKGKQSAVMSSPAFEYNFSVLMKVLHGMLIDTHNLYYVSRNDIDTVTYFIGTTV